MKVVFLGYGHMGGALGEAWKASGLAGEVLAVKPAQAVDALRALPGSLLEGAAVVSIAAALPAGTPVVRAMPNTPVIRNAGCTGLFAGTASDAGLRERIGRLFAAVGSAHWVAQESLLDAVTALSGSGPAYYHLFSEALAAAGIALGLEPALARQLAADTAWGAATLQHAPGADFAALRRAVTSPNGTTAAALDVFERDGALRQLVGRAALAAQQRAVELSAG